MGFPLLSLLMQLALFVLLGLIAHAEAASNDSDISLVHRGEAFWLCRTGTKGVSCGSRREPVLNDSKVYCGSGFCCPDTEDVVPQTCKEEPCEKQFPRTPGACNCEQFAHSCTSSDGASHCVDIPLSGRLSGAACVCKSPYTADQRRQKCVLNVCEDNACGPPEAVKFCYPSRVVTSPPGQTKSEATCVCAPNFVLNSALQKCVPAPYDRCDKEAPCGPVEGVNTCSEHPITGKFICTCRSGYVLNTRDNQCQKRCSEEEAALCGSTEAHDAESCSMGIGGRVCACKDGYTWDAALRQCVASDCYLPSCGWPEGVATCEKKQGKSVCTCVDGFQMNASGECLPECPAGWRYNRNRELCELPPSACPLTDCGSDESVEACLVDKDSGTQICKCKAGYGLDTRTGKCASLTACDEDTCQPFGPDAVCVSDGSVEHSCQCITMMKTVGNETTPVVKACDPVECPDPSICGYPEAVMECLWGASAHHCLCNGMYMLNVHTGKCVPRDMLMMSTTKVPEGSLRVSASRAPLHFRISAAPCVRAEFNTASRTFDVQAYHTSGEYHTTRLTLPYHSGHHTGVAFTCRISPAPGGFDVSLVYELRPSKLRQTVEQTSFRVYTDPVTRQAVRDAAGSLEGAVAAVKVSAKQTPCEISNVAVVAMSPEDEDQERFENLKILLKKLPTADANAPSTPSGFPELNGGQQQPGETEVDIIAFPSPSEDTEEPPEPEKDTPLQFPSPTDPVVPTESGAGASAPSTGEQATEPGNSGGPGTSNPSTDDL